MTYHPYHILGEDRPSRWLITCDHAANTVPPCVGNGDLGVSPGDMARHIAYDVGAAGVSRHLSELLDAPAILSNFSRLVIDPNRGEDDPTLVMKLYDGTVIPANRHVDQAERDRRLTAFHRPYHRAIAQLAARQANTVILAMHSYTPQLQGREKRPWHIAILHDRDSRLATPLIARLRQEPDLCVGENEPYGGHLDGDSIDRHAVLTGRVNVLIEIRNDLIENEDQQRGWAERLAPILTETLAKTGL
ncbi:N-formylglutamate amidohydrolase [Aliiroseovarius zhejiangensis]|uniref:N-formylglutamate amidohydrolase n=1 Tax=Aliiroseovarius zhejiangensis TaxID=1632025 RepID=A0ABQ3JBS3_9RHOB|nr:N-formylglutamate amidohydrolase [Aliiroseovarius zhejiangensis]GHF08900.1 N-formylglutamate amidohydrolase [Aliiroseovarius zhejiangensis]